MEPLFELGLDLPPRGSGDRLKSLHRQLREAIRSGRLAAGTRLPATRTLARLLGVSRNTALAAYDLLLSEGYLQARHGSGTFVATLRTAAQPSPRHAPAADRLLHPLWQQMAGTLHAPRPADWRFDFRVGLPDVRPFPFDVWRRLNSRARREAARRPAEYGAPQGDASLRAAIAAHVSFARAVACTADDVIVTAGAQQAFDLLARVLVQPGRSTVAFEEPGYPPARAAFTAAGANAVGVPVDAEGLMVQALPADARVVMVTPSHQFPLGVTLSARRRAALLDHARRRDAVVIEDDYDGEFRFGGRPLDALRTLDADGRVFYVGTFSKSLFPGLRLGFVVAPAWARPALRAARQCADWHSSLPTQRALAAFIAEGHLARHVRRMRRLYAERREAVLQALQRHAEGRVTTVGEPAGLHLSLALHGRLRAESIAQRAAAEGIGVEPLARYAHASPLNGLVLGYGLADPRQIEAGIRQLSQWLR
jgi:GntR family transcriptional regulator/MocR family aminotransferase